MHISSPLPPLRALWMSPLRRLRARSPRRAIVLSLVLLVISANGLVACGAPAEGQENLSPSDDEASPDLESATARRVEVAVLNASDATVRLRLPGEVEGLRDAVLAAPAGGYIERVRVENGAEVRRGQVLVSVDAASHEARLAQARVELAAAERELGRARQLEDAIPAAQRDAADTRHAAAVAALRTASLTASRAVLRAPFAGQVADVDAEVGEVAAPGQALVRLVHLDRVKVTVSVPDRDVVSLRVGMKARVSVEAAAAAFEGEITHINPTADMSTRAFPVEIEVDNAERSLLPGMIATVEVQESVASGELLVPQDWIVTGIDELGVFLEEDGVARWRSVQLGRVVSNQVVLRDGLSEGDRVIVTGHRELVDGEAVLAVRTGRCCESGRVVFE